MAAEVKIPLGESDIYRLRAGDRALLSGRMITGRDAAHKRLITLLDAGEPLPVNLAGQAIYYVGPCPAPPGRAIGSCGPTTSGRMDAWTPRLLALGLKGMVGKGPRSKEVVEAMKAHGAVYFAATGGAGALLSQCVKECRVLAFEDLGAEAIYELVVENFPVTVAIDSQGNDLYRMALADGK